MVQNDRCTQCLHLEHFIHFTNTRDVLWRTSAGVNSLQTQHSSELSSSSDELSLSTATGREQLLDIPDGPGRGSAMVTGLETIVFLAFCILMIPDGINYAAFSDSVPTNQSA